MIISIPMKRLSNVRSPYHAISLMSRIYEEQMADGDLVHCASDEFRSESNSADHTRSSMKMKAMATTITMKGSQLIYSTAFAKSIPELCGADNVDIKKVDLLQRHISKKFEGSSTLSKL